jgi:hypothetical protein
MSENDISKPVPKAPSPRIDEWIRIFLVIWIALLMLLELILYCLTRDAVVLLSSTVVGMAVPFVFRYYFSRQQKK